MKLKLGKEHIVVQGIRPEEKLWGPYRFPIPYFWGIATRYPFMSRKIRLFTAESRNRESTGSPALFDYSDFYNPDEKGIKRKTILCREIVVTELKKPMIEK